MLVSALTDDGPLFCHWAILPVRFHFHSTHCYSAHAPDKETAAQTLELLYCLLLDCVKFKVQHV